MSKKKDAFEPTIEEATMSSGLHRQGTKSPALDELIEERLGKLKGPRIKIEIPEEQEVDIKEVTKDLESLADKLGDSVSVDLSFTIRKKK